MTEEKFIEQIKGIDLPLWKRQMVTVMEMQEDWRLDDSDQTWKKEKAEEVDGLVEVLGIICDFIEPIKEEKE